MTEKEQAEVRRRQVLKKLTMTRRGETVGLMYWEVAVLLDYIDDLKRGKAYGSAEVQTADSAGKIDRNGRW